jgi:Universal stress protein family.
MIPSEIPLIGYKKILYTTGLREQSRFAFHHAASLSEAYQAQLTVFHVVPGDDEMDQRLLTYVDEKLWQQIKSISLREVKQL